MEKYIIPRNIKIKESVVYGLNGKQIIYLSIGVAGGLSAYYFGASLPTHIRIAIALYSVASSLAFTLCRLHGQDLDRYTFNAVRYPLRTKEYGGEEDGKKLVVNIRYSTR